MRLLELDSLRGIAALSVVLFHYTFLYNKTFGLSEALPLVFNIGYVGVGLFFMISGFVIFYSIKKCKYHRNFIVTRSARIFPAYWIAIILTALITNNYTLTLLQHSWADVLINFSMLQSFIGIKNVDHVYWTLAYELLFYFFMYLFYRLNLIKHITKIIIIWLLFQTLSILATKYIGYFPWKLTVFFMLKYIHLFLAGIIFQKLYESPEKHVYYLILLHCLINQWLGGNFAGSTAVSIFFVIFILFINGWLKWIITKPLLFLGTISYPLYLTHQNIGYVIIHYLQANNISALPAVFITLVFSLILATLISFYIEKPAMRKIRSRFIKR